MRHLLMAVTSAVLLFTAGQALATTKVGFIYVGPRNDYGYNYAQDQGRLYLEQNTPGVETVSFENIPENADVERVMERMIRSGVTIVFPTSYGYLDSALKVAGRHPDVVFMHSGGFKLAPNLGTYFAGIDEAMYLGGITAGAATESGKLGFIAAHPIPQVLRNINAFTRGAQSVNPDVTTTVVWTGTWSDPAKESEAVNSLVDSGVDVITGHVDSPITYTQAAEKRGIHVVGYHADASKFAPTGWLVGAVWNWGPMMEGIVTTVEDGSWNSEHIRGGLKTGDSVLSGYGPSVSEETKAKVAATNADILAGKMDIWQGPVVNQDGSELVAEGNVLADDGLEGMDFFVQGVIGQVK